MESDPASVCFTIAALGGYELKGAMPVVWGLGNHETFTANSLREPASVGRKRSGVWALNQAQM